jgi:hypothetical protein
MDRESRVFDSMIIIPFSSLNTDHKSKRVPVRFGCDLYTKQRMIHVLVERKKGKSQTVECIRSMKDTEVLV